MTATIIKDRKMSQSPEFVHPFVLSLWPWCLSGASILWGNDPRCFI